MTIYVNNFNLIDLLTETLDSLLAQSMVPDMIYINVPNDTIPSRTGQFYHIPSYLLSDYVRPQSTLRKIIPTIPDQDDAFMNCDVKSASNGDCNGAPTEYTETWKLFKDSIDIIQGNRVSIIKSNRDYGPLTKLFPTLIAETDPETLIITVDDDKCYHKDTVKHIAWYSMQEDNVAWGDCGWGFQRVPHEIEVVPIYVPFVFRGQGGRDVQVLQACCGNGYRRKFFQNLLKLSQIPPRCFTTDDLWISGYLHFYSEIKRTLIKENIQPSQTEWKKTKEQTQWALSSHNSANMQDIKCINAIETMFGKLWFDQ